MECPICTEELNEPFFETDCCKQALHSMCFDKCVKLNSRCPFCRTVIISITINPIANNLVVIEPRNELFPFFISLVCCTFLISFIVIFPMRFVFKRNYYYEPTDDFFNITNYNNT